MYLFKVKVQGSEIEGAGVFAEEEVAKGSVVWRFEPGYDHMLSQDEYSTLNPELQNEIRRVAYVSPTTHLWVYPPLNDPARFTNHAETTNTLRVVFDKSISNEPFFVAKSNIRIGEELTVNYAEFDESIKNKRPNWMI